MGTDTPTGDLGWPQLNDPTAGVYDPAVGSERPLTQSEAWEVYFAETRQEAQPNTDLGDPYDGIELGLSRRAGYEPV